VSKLGGVELWAMACKGDLSALLCCSLRGIDEIENENCSKPKKANIDCVRYTFVCCYCGFVYALSLFCIRGALFRPFLT
jgi:hypothetical protein